MSAPPFGSGNTGFTFGQQTQQPVTQMTTSTLFAPNTSTAGFSFSSGGAMSFPRPQANQPTAFGFGGTQQQSQQQQQQQQHQTSGFGFGTASNPANVASTTPLAFGTQPTATSTSTSGFAFGGTVGFGNTQSLGMNFGGNAASPAQTTVATTKVNFPFGSGGLVFGNATQTPASTVASVQFGATTSTATTGFGVFGGSVAPAATTSMGTVAPFSFSNLGFGAAQSTASTTPTIGFLGQTAQTASSNIPITAGLTFKTPVLTTTTQQSVPPVFGASLTTSTSSTAPFSFGALSTTPVSSNSTAFGLIANTQPQTTPSGGLIFGQSTETSAPATGFLGGQNVQSTATGFMFGQSTPQTSQATGITSKQTPTTTLPQIGGQNQTSMPTCSTLSALSTSSSATPAFQVLTPLATPLAIISTAMTTTTTASSAPTFTPFGGIKLGSVTTSAPAMTTSTPVSTAPTAPFGGAVPLTNTTTGNVSLTGFTFPGLTKTVAITTSSSTGTSAISTSDPLFSTKVSSSSSTSSTTAPPFSLGGLSSTTSSIGTAPTLTLGGMSTAITTSSTTVSTTAAATPTMNFRQLEEAINKWTLELEDQEKIYLNQATQVNAWDRLLIKNGEKITQLNDDLERVKLDQQHLEHEIDFILAQQKELEDLLVPLEQKVEQTPSISIQQHADLEREHTYQLAENIDAQMKRMAEDLKEMIDHINASNSVQDSNDPICQVGKILNAHMDSLQWIEQNTNLVQRKLEEVTQLYEVRRKDQERRFRLAYE